MILSDKRTTLRSLQWDIYTGRAQNRCQEPRIHRWPSITLHQLLHRALHSSTCPKRRFTPCQMARPEARTGGWSCPNGVTVYFKRLFELPCTTIALISHVNLYIRYSYTRDVTYCGWVPMKPTMALIRPRTHPHRQSQGFAPTISSPLCPRLLLRPNELPVYGLQMFCSFEGNTLPLWDLGGGVWLEERHRHPTPLSWKT